MKSLLLLLLVVPLANLAALEELSPFVRLPDSNVKLEAATMPNGITYFVQLIHGNDRDASPSPGTHRVGLRLQKVMQAAFRQKSFWEIKRQEVTIPPGRKATVTLPNGREVLIDLSELGKRKVTAFHEGELMGRAVRPVGLAMTIIGGNDTGENVWFVVVRRDNPSQQ